jgi:hypothetical protein
MLRKISAVQIETTAPQWHDLKDDFGKLGSGNETARFH